jgi:hypothetical protein
MMVDTADLVSAENLVPGPRRYVVVMSTRDDGLQVGDHVVLCDQPRGNLLFRFSDSTVHSCAEPVIMVPLDSVALEKSK